jgi:hypothetical protein
MGCKGSECAVRTRILFAFIPCVFLIANTEGPDIKNRTATKGNIGFINDISISNLICKPIDSKESMTKKKQKM